MVFDPCPHQITQLVLRAGAIIRELRGFPEEKNITLLYNETAPLLGISIQMMSSKDIDHLPAPHEMKKEDGMPLIPLQKCPQCGEDSMQVFSLCRTCKDAEGGKYKTKFICPRCHYEKKSEKAMVQWLNEFGIDFKTQTKESLGIKTLTDKGEE